MSGLEDATYKNIDACMQLTNCVRTSMGPNGMNKMVINHLEKLFVTSDSATIMKELEVQHPAAKLLVLASNMQEQEIGDGTNFVVVFAGELLKQAEELLRMGLHQSEIILGYQKALVKSLEILKEIIVHTCEDLHNVEAVTYAIKACIAAKQHGFEDFLAPFIAQACVQVMPANAKGFNVDNVRVAKIIGGGVKQTTVVNGMCIPRRCHGTIKHVTDAKVAVFGCELDAAAPETKGTVLITSAEQLLNYSKSEEIMMEKQIKTIHEAGINVIVCGQTIGEMAQHFIDRYGMMSIKIASKFELRRVCRTVGANTVIRMDEEIKPEHIGHCDVVTETEIGSSPCVIFRNDKEGCKVSTIVVRGSTSNVLDDIERAIDDGVNVVKAMGKDARFVTGAAAAEIHIAHRLAQYAETQPGLDQYAINKFSEAFEIIPRTLTENAGGDATTTISSLYTAHASTPNPAECLVGIDIENGGVFDAKAAGILDLYLTKETALRLAVDAAITVLRVDQIIMSKPAGGPKAPQGGGDDD